MFVKSTNLSLSLAQLHSVFFFSFVLVGHCISKALLSKPGYHDIMLMLLTGRPLLDRQFILPRSSLVIPGYPLQLLQRRVTRLKTLYLATIYPDTAGQWISTHTPQIPSAHVLSERGPYLPSTGMVVIYSSRDLRS